MTERNKKGPFYPGQEVTTFAPSNDPNYFSPQKASSVNKRQKLLSPLPVRPPDIRGRLFLLSSSFQSLGEQIDHALFFVNFDTLREKLITPPSIHSQKIFPPNKRQKCIRRMSFLSPRRETGKQQVVFVLPSFRTKVFSSGMLPPFVAGCHPQRSEAWQAQ